MKAAIVTTLINAELVLDFFISYHLSIGFDHLFLFFDDPDDPSIGIVEKYAQVSIIPKDQCLRKKWEKTRLLNTHRAYGEFIEKETMARQLLNVEVANEMAIEKGITWLLHIDIDELFYTSHGTVKAHFERLTAEKKTHVTYANHEAVPETVSVDNFFKEVTLFKKNISALSNWQIELINKQAIFGYGRTYFLYYSIGKSAVKVNPGLVPLTVHSFLPTVEVMSSDPCVLHFPVCGFDHFQRKYKTLGEFSDHWFGIVDIENNIPFHIHSRNEICKKNELSALEFYKRCIMISNESKIDELIRAGVFFRLIL